MISTAAGRRLLNRYTKDNKSKVVLVNNSVIIASITAASKKAFSSAVPEWLHTDHDDLRQIGEANDRYAGRLEVRDAGERGRGLYATDQRSVIQVRYSRRRFLFRWTLCKMSASERHNFNQSEFSTEYKTVDMPPWIRFLKDLATTSDWTRRRHLGWRTGSGGGGWWREIGVWTVDV